MPTKLCARDQAELADGEFFDEEIVGAGHQHLN